MIVVHGIPVYWGIETEPADRSFLTRATLHEVLPPFRQSIHAFRIRVSHRHWLHLGTCTYDREMRRWRLDATTEEISTWGRRNGDVEEEEAAATPVEAGSTEPG
jgi:hypothetical protein